MYGRIAGTLGALLLREAAATATATATTAARGAALGPRPLALRRLLAPSTTTTTSSSSSSSFACFSTAVSSREQELEKKLSVAQLKYFLDSAGIDYRDCYEKRELVSRLHSAQSALSPHLQNELSKCLEGGGGPGARFDHRTAGFAGLDTPSSLLLPEEQRTIAIFDRCAPSVTHITTSALVQKQPFSLDISEIPYGTGSGFVWDHHGHVVTNYHVVRNAQKAKVSLSDNTSWEATLVGAEPDKDLAVLHIDAKAEGKTLVPLSIGSSHSLRVGQKVFAIGNPFGLDQTLTTGIVSGVGRDIKGITGRPIRGVVQVTNPPTHPTPSIRQRPTDRPTDRLRTPSQPPSLSLSSFK